MNTTPQSRTPRTLTVAGRFDRDGGRPSHTAARIQELMRLPDATFINGGTLETLARVVDLLPEERPDRVFWFPDIPNDAPKLVGRLKAIHPEHVLTTSKNNTEGNYRFIDLVSRALAAHANLFVEFTREDNRYAGRVGDPLGNVFLDTTTDLCDIAAALRKRSDELLGYRRVRTQQIPSTAASETTVPLNPAFLGIVKAYAETFHALINPDGENAGRFMGNASFRCERGFPSERVRDGTSERIYVSRRNIDKRAIDASGFVRVEPGLPVQYHGATKPSVDTPIQLALYQNYPRINFMLHAHVYLEGAPYTSRIIPCGALEEAGDIMALAPDRDASAIRVNLFGHGSLVLSDSVDELRGLPYTARSIPEVHPSYIVEARASEMTGERHA